MLRGLYAFKPIWSKLFLWFDVSRYGYYDG